MKTVSISGKKYLAAAIIGLGALTAMPASSQTILESLAKAYATNPQFLSQRAGLKAISEEVPQALANWRPSIEITGESGVEQVDTDSSTATRHPKAGELSITQPLFRGFRTIAETRRARARVNSEKANLKATEQNLLFDAARAYINVVRDKAVLELNRRNERRVARQLQAAQDRFRVGEITRTDVAQAEARLARAKADVIQSVGAFVNAGAAYQRIIGEAPGAVTLPNITLDLPGSAEEARELAQSINPNVQRAFYRVQAARHNVGLVRGELLPELELRGSYTKEENVSSSVDQRDTAELKAELTIPLYQGGEVYSRLRAAKRGVEQRTDELDNARRIAIEAAASAWNRLQTARAAVTSFRAEVRASEIALDGVQREALVGSRTVLDVLDAEQELLDAKVNLVRSERDELVARFELMAAVGNLTAQNLKLAVTFHDDR